VWRQLGIPLGLGEGDRCGRDEHHGVPAAQGVVGAANRRGVQRGRPEVAP
jgi:hypothetical protein